MKNDLKYQKVEESEPTKRTTTNIQEE